MLPDSEVIRRVQNGQTQHFAELVARYRATVYALAYRMLGTREEAEDAAQDTFIRALQSIRTFQNDLSFWPWIRRITINCCLRRLPRDVATGDVDEIVESRQVFVDEVQAEVFRRCDSRRVLDALSELPVANRTVLVMKYQGGMTCVEIAEALGVSAGSVRVRVHRALKALSEGLAVTCDAL